MLNLTRYAGEKIVIWRDGRALVTLVVDGVDEDGRVNLGFSAPRDILIDREEVYKRRVKEVTDRKEQSYSNHVVGNYEDRNGNV